MSRINPSRQVSMSAARAGSPAFTEGQHIEKKGVQNRPFLDVQGGGGEDKVQKVYKQKALTQDCSNSTNKV